MKDWLPPTEEQEQELRDLARRMIANYPKWLLPENDYEGGDYIRCTMVAYRIGMHVFAGGRHADTVSARDRFEIAQAVYREMRREQEKGTINGS